MGLDINNTLQLNATMVSNEFIDRYMVSANGEYVKVYLYLLLHGQEIKDLSAVADALNHTEADIKRAITYWEKQGILKGKDQKEPKDVIPMKTARTSYTPDQLKKLGQDEVFSQLLYIAQKYMNKIFTPRECEVFAYLYDELKMNAELIEYVVEYCVQGGHISLRYMETVALDWHSKGIKTVEAARNSIVHYNNDMFAVMKAFGLQDRKPGSSEVEMLKRWFQEYGFTREIVLEACKRTLEAIQKPSFPYTEAILAEWSRSGVKRFGDIEKLDKSKDAKKGAMIKTQSINRNPKNSKNQFHNFEQRDTNYDALVLERLKERLEES